MRASSTGRPPARIAPARSAPNVISACCPIPPGRTTRTSAPRSASRSATMAIGGSLGTPHSSTVMTAPRPRRARAGPAAAGTGRHRRPAGRAAGTRQRTTSRRAGPAKKSTPSRAAPPHPHGERRYTGRDRPGRPGPVDRAVEADQVDRPGVRAGRLRRGQQQGVGRAEWPGGAEPDLGTRQPGRVRGRRRDERMPQRPGQAVRFGPVAHLARQRVQPAERARVQFHGGVVPFGPVRPAARPRPAAGPPGSGRR